MAIVGIATMWWRATCLRCGVTQGMWVEEPEVDHEPYCYLDGVFLMKEAEEMLAALLRFPLQRAEHHYGEQYF